MHPERKRPLDEELGMTRYEFANRSITFGAVLAVILVLVALVALIVVAYSFFA